MTEVLFSGLFNLWNFKMSFIARFNSHEMLYEQHLSVIKDVKFTFREIDLIACIIHNRGEKKIAYLLSISPRTVSAHVYNVMNKLGCNSKDQIIDFIEKSGKLSVLREYYVHLLIKAHFEKKLVKIASQINVKGSKYYCTRDDSLTLSKGLYQSIQNHLKLANIELIEVSQKQTGQGDYKDFPIRNIEEDDYYFSLLKTLTALEASEKLDELIREFADEYKVTVEVYEGKSHTDPKTIINFRWLKSLLKDKKYLVMIPVGILVIALTGRIIFTTSSAKLPSEATTANIEQPQTIKNLEEFLELTKNNQFSANNIDKQQAQNNQSLVKKVEKLLDYQNIQEIQEYFDKAEMAAPVLVQYLYNLQALSSYYMYNHYNGIKAQEILLYAKELAEHYINHRSNVKIDFNNLTPEEVYTELSVVSQLPEIYTRLVYLYGRSYIYLNEHDAGKKFFVLAKYLGSKLNLLEAHLSDVSGLLVIEKEAANNYLQQGKLEEAIAVIATIIAKYTALANLDNAYITDFNPALKEQQLVTENQKIYNSFHCNSQIIDLYGMLITISPDREQTLNYLSEITQLLGNESSDKGLWQIMNHISPKKTATLYNILGNILLKLEKLAINEPKIIRAVEKGFSASNTKPNSPPRNLSNLSPEQFKRIYLELAEQLFETAKINSRNTDYTKADAYDGLYKVYQQQLLNPSLTEEQKGQLKAKLDDCAIKRDKINEQLNRKAKVQL